MVTILVDIQTSILFVEYIFEVVIYPALGVAVGYLLG